MTWKAPERAIELGKTYQFNAEKAKVVELSYDEIGWRSPRARGRNPVHRVPRWYFEKYASMLPQRST